MVLKFACGVSIIVVALVVARVVSVDRTRPQGFDEPAHVAAGMEWLQFHTYHLDPLHPPIARVAAAGLLYLSGVRFREANSGLLPQFWSAGNSILYQGDYLRNLALARFGMLPFLALTLAVIFLWTRRQFGWIAALAAVLLTSTLPVVLAFSSLAYTDFPAACLQLCCILAFAEWLDRPAWTYSAGLGALFGFAVLTKFTSLLYVPIAALAILLCRCFLLKRSESNLLSRPQHAIRFAFIGLIAIVVIWGGYRFSVGRVDEAMGISQNQVPSFQHFPGPVRGLAREMVASDWNIPAPSFFTGLGEMWVLNKSEQDAYLWGKFKAGGWWYFFLVEAFFKTPLPFLVLLAMGCRHCYRGFLARDSKSLVPALAAFSVLIFTTAVSVNSGLRHVLVIFPFLAIVAGCGASELWEPSRRPFLGKAVLVSLIGWQCVIALRPGTDWISYFNELAGPEPSRILVSGCDLDCGQDVLNLSQELRRRGADRVGLALWTSADLQKMGLPQFEVLEPFRPATGWVAVSLRAMREGSVQHNGYPPSAFSWLGRYSPVARVGNTIWLYNIPSLEQANAQVSAPDAKH